MFEHNSNLLLLSTIFSIDSIKIKSSKLWYQNQLQAIDYLGKLVRIPNFDKTQRQQLLNGKFEIAKKGIFRQKTIVLSDALLEYKHCIIDLHTDSNLTPDSVYIAGNTLIEVIAQKNYPICSQINEMLLVKIYDFDYQKSVIFILTHFEKFSVVLRISLGDKTVQHCRLLKRLTTNDPYQAYDQYLYQESQTKNVKPQEISFAKLLNTK